MFPSAVPAGRQGFLRLAQMTCPASKELALLLTSAMAGFTQSLAKT
jgi:hypothetical protein